MALVLASAIVRGVPYVTCDRVAVSPSFICSLFFHYKFIFYYIINFIIKGYYKGAGLFIHFFLEI